MTPDEPEDLRSTVVRPEDEAQQVADHTGQLQIVVLGSGTVATYPLPEVGAITIGRGSSCDIAINDESISRKHARLTIGDDTLTIEDLGSGNGTKVRGNRLAVGKSVPISIGELVTLGEASMLVQQRTRVVQRRTLWTHDYFEARLEQECAREQRSGGAFALVHLHAKKRGPAASVVEEALCSQVRESDVVGKYGPHEYELLLTDTTPPLAEEAVARIDRKLRERGIECSILVACSPRDGRSAYQLASRINELAANNSAPVGTTSDIVVMDPQMQSLHRMIEQVAGAQIGVLLLGETGVGKEVFARAVHRASRRAQGPFIEINCAALPETLLESELFGHEKGAFTNALAAKPGLIEMADGGTLLLDEIGDMPLATQAKLLRVIEDSQLRRVGGLKTRSFDVRFVSATNCDLENEITIGKFRRDLYFRLNGVTIVIPPLRERLAELEALALSFTRRLNPRGTLSPDALEAMKTYSWPGNVRELKNMIERAVLLSQGGPIRSEHLPVEKMRATRMTDQLSRLMPPPTDGQLAMQPRRGSPQEEAWIMQALDRTNGNQTLAARLLGISRRTLVNRLNEYSQVHRPRKHKNKPDSDS